GDPLSLEYAGRLADRPSAAIGSDARLRLRGKDRPVPGRIHADRPVGDGVQPAAPAAVSLRRAADDVVLGGKRVEPQELLGGPALDRTDAGARTAEEAGAAVHAGHRVPEEDP